MGSSVPQTLLGMVKDGLFSVSFVRASVRMLQNYNQMKWSSCVILFWYWITLLEGNTLTFFHLTLVPFQPMEIYVDDEAKLTLHGLVQVKYGHVMCIS